MSTRLVQVKPTSKSKQYAMNLHDPKLLPQNFGQCWECYREFKPAFRCQVYCHYCRSELVIVSKVRTGKRR